MKCETRVIFNDKILERDGLLIQKSSAFAKHAKIFPIR